MYRNLWFSGRRKVSGGRSVTVGAVGGVTMYEYPGGTFKTVAEAIDLLFQSRGLPTIARPQEVKGG